MIPYVETRIPTEELSIFRKIEGVVSRLPSVDLGTDEEGNKMVLSCHILARAVAKVFGLEYVDGFYHQGFEHTWLMTKSRNIIDVYPVATVGGPIMMDMSVVFSPAHYLYKRERLGRGFGQNSFKRAVRRVTREIRRNTE